jgi:hypothetical protein
MTPEKLLLLNLIARMGLSAAIQVYEIVITAPTDTDAIASLKAANIKTADDYLREDKEARGL